MCSYYSLGKLADIQARFTDGSYLYLLTDHRTASEIESERELSAVLATVRTLQASKLARRNGGDYRIVYALNSQVPDFLHRAIVSADGFVEVNQVEQRLDSQPMGIDELLDCSFKALATIVAAKTGRPYTIEALRELEGIYASKHPGIDKDEIEFWAAVLELGAFGAEVLRGLKGGGWVRDDSSFTFFGTSYRCSEQDIDVDANLIDKAAKCLENPEEDSVAGVISETIEVIEQTKGRRSSHQDPTPTAQPGAGQIPPRKGGFFSRMRKGR